MYMVFFTPRLYPVELAPAQSPFDWIHWRPTGRPSALTAFNLQMLSVMFFVNFVVTGIVSAELSPLPNEYPAPVNVYRCATPT